MVFLWGRGGVNSKEDFVLKRTTSFTQQNLTIDHLKLKTSRARRERKVADGGGCVITFANCLFQRH